MVPVNSVNHTRNAQKTFSNEVSTVGTTSMRMLSENQAVNARSNNTNIVSGKYYLWYMDRYVKAMTSNVFPMEIYNLDGTGWQLISSTNTVDSAFVSVGGVFEGRNGGTRLSYGRNSNWTGEVFIDNNTLIEISKADYDAFRAGTLTLSQIIAKYPVK